MTDYLKVKVDVEFQHNTETYIVAFSEQPNVSEYNLRDFIILKKDDPIFDVSIVKTDNYNEAKIYQYFANIDSDIVSNVSSTNTPQYLYVYALSLVTDLNALNSTTSSFVKYTLI